MSRNIDPDYRIYLITIWNENADSGTEAPRWRYRLEDPRTGHYELFTDQQSLVEHMARWTAGLADEDSGDS